MKILMDHSMRLSWLMIIVLGALTASCGNDRDPIMGMPGISPVDTTRPSVTLTIPANTAIAVAINAQVTATFSEDVKASTLTSTSFTLTAPGNIPVAGSVSYAAGAKTAIFTPAAALPVSTLLRATVTTVITDTAGNALAGNQAPLPAASSFVWTFTTGTTSDTAPPTLTQLSPAALSTGLCLKKSVSATFNKAMDPATITSTSFLLKKSGPPLSSTVAGSVTYDVAGKTANFFATSDLASNTNYTVTVTTAAKDLAGNALASPQVWTFTTGTQTCAPAASINLAAAAPFGNLGGTSGSTNTGLLTQVNGDISTTATTTSSVTGFHDSVDIYTETPSDSGTVNGTIYTCTISTTGPTSVTPNPAACLIATQARADAQTAFNQLSPAQLPGGTDPGAGQLGGLTLAPGIYKSALGSFLITGSDLTLDGQGDSNALWVFQTASTLTVGAPAAPRSVILINGAQAKNVFWQVGSSATINGAGGGTMVGTILASAGVSLSTVGNADVVTLNGRAAGLNASVTMTNTIVNVPAP